MRRSYSCVKCGQNHDSTTCSNNTDTPPKCALCESQHLANYKDCEIYKEIRNRKYSPIRERSVTKQQPEQLINISSLPSPIQTAGNQHTGTVTS
ncbi:hypothetical protein QLX08_010479 [Tetragonisca angustula]|uniref:Uncharacterized protein n=1 Tax=Tetragonisca angustula TaxID=166442 RepID=A0AAW0ZCB3_9HYME